MLAGLSGWLRNIADHLRTRRLIPPNGDAYEQFNLSVLLFTIVFCNYVLAEPAPTTQETLDWLLGETPLLVWRVFLFTGAVVAVFTSYIYRWHRIGLAALFYVAFVWAGALLVGFFGAPTPQGFASAVIYGAIARHSYHLAKRGA